MLIPNSERAVVDIRKLRDYCLNPLHDEGKHKARLFAAIGLTANEAEELRATLLQVVKSGDARLGRHDSYGQRYIVDFPLTWRGKQSLIRSGWIIEHGTETPRLTTCYPL
jgi:hypothetical protein